MAEDAAHRRPEAMDDAQFSGHVRSAAQNRRSRT
jgi:hypothetical protein